MKSYYVDYVFPMAIVAFVLLSGGVLIYIYDAMLSDDALKAMVDRGVREHAEKAVDAAMREYLNSAVKSLGRDGAAVDDISTHPHIGQLHGAKYELSGTCISFMSASGYSSICIDIDTGKWTIDGDAHETAKAFFEQYLKPIADEYISEHCETVP